MDNANTQRERERRTGQVGVMIGAGAAKTGLFWMRGGGEGEEELSLAKTEGRSVAFLREDWAEEVDERVQLLMEAVDIAQYPSACWLDLSP